MGGPSGLNVGLPILSNPSAFARSIVSKAGGVRGSTLLQEVVLEEAGLKRLARVLKAVSEGRYVSAKDRARVERVIASLAARDWPTIRKALAAAQWGDSRFRQDRFADFDPKALGAILLPLPVATGRAVQLSAGGASSGPVAQRRKPGMQAWAGLMHDPATVVPAGHAVVSSPKRVDDEEALVGPDRKRVLSDFLNQHRVSEFTLLDIALNILENPQQSLAMKVIAIRVLGDNIGRLDILNMFLRTLEVIVAQFKSEVDPRLKEMALAFLKQLDSSLRPGLIEFFSQAIIKISSGAYFLVPIRLYLPGSELSLGSDDLGFFQERIVSLKAILEANYPAELPTPSNFELGERIGGRFAWHSAYPPWYSILPKVLGISGKGEELAQQARAIFMDVHRHQLWQQGLALVYYSFLLHPSQGPLSRDEANQATRDLLQLIREGLFPEMASAVYSHVIYNQVNAPLSPAEGGEEGLNTSLWVSAKINELAVVVGWEHPEVRRLLDLTRHLERRAETLRAQSNPPSPPSFWQRAATALRRLFN